MYEQGSRSSGRLHCMRSEVWMRWGWEVYKRKYVCSTISRLSSSTSAFILHSVRTSTYLIVYLFPCLHSIHSISLLPSSTFFFDFTTTTTNFPNQRLAHLILHFKPPVFSIKTFSLHIFKMPSIRSLLAGIAITSITLLQSTSAAPTPAPPCDKPTTPLALPVNGGTSLTSPLTSNPTY